VNDGRFLEYFLIYIVEVEGRGKGRGVVGNFPQGFESADDQKIERVQENRADGRMKTSESEKCRVRNRFIIPAPLFSAWW
jgi:hypothetical protein